MGRQMYRAEWNQRDLLPYAEAFADGDEVVWKVGIFNELWECKG